MRVGWGEMNKMEEMGIGMEKMKRLNNYRRASPGCSIVLRAPCCSSDHANQGSLNSCDCHSLLVYEAFDASILVSTT